MYMPVISSCDGMVWLWWGSSAALEATVISRSLVLCLQSSAIMPHMPKSLNVDEWHAISLDFKFKIQLNASPSNSQKSIPCELQ
jgi:hypothetical protein